MWKLSIAGVGLAKYGLVVTLAATLAGCGGSDSPATLPVANADATVAVGTETAAALVPAVGASRIFATFLNGFLGTDGSSGPVSITDPTTVAFTSSGNTTGFTISDGTYTATGVTTFGSCIFTVTASNYQAGPLVVGSVVTVNPCNIKASTNGVSANGIPSSRDVVLVLGESSSEPIKLDVTVQTDGTVVIGTTEIGDVTLTQTTGGGN